MDQSLPNHQPGGSLKHGNNPSQERAITGDKQGKWRQRSRLSQSESQTYGAEEELPSSIDASGSYGRSPTLQGIQAEGNNHRCVASNGSRLLSSSPRSPNTKGYLNSKSRRTRSQQQDGGQPITTVKASGTPHRQSSRGRNRTSSETEHGGKSRKEPTRRKGGLSETESCPMWDNYNMSELQCLASENIWYDKHHYDEAEKRFYEGVNGPSPRQQQVKTALQQAKGRHQKRQHRNSSSHAGDQELVSKMKSLEVENQNLHKVVENLRAALQKLETRVTVLEKSPASAVVPCNQQAPPVQAAPSKQVEDDDDDDDDIDLFGSDEDDEETARIKQERLDAYTAKKSKKPALIAKSSILLDVKPWDDETDMAKLEECVRSVQMDGLLWGASKLVPVGYGIKKLQINCVVEDDKVGTDILEEEITKFEDFVQSVDVAAFNKI